MIYNTYAVQLSLNRKVRNTNHVQRNFYISCSRCHCIKYKHALLFANESHYNNIKEALYTKNWSPVSYTNGSGIAINMPYTGLYNFKFCLDGVAQPTSTTFSSCANKMEEFISKNLNSNVEYTTSNDNLIAWHASVTAQSTITGIQYCNLGDWINYGFYLNAGTVTHSI